MFGASVFRQSSGFVKAAPEIYGAVSVSLLYHEPIHHLLTLSMASLQRLPARRLYFFSAGIRIAVSVVADLQPLFPMPRADLLLVHVLSPMLESSFLVG